MDYRKYFKIDGKSTIFTGDKLEVFVPVRYGDRGYLDVTNSVKTIGVFDMVINGSIEVGLMLAGEIEIFPDDIETATIDNNKYLKLILRNGDTFINDNRIVKDSKISYVMFYEIFHTGHYPKFLTYDLCFSLFDEVSKATGDKFSTDHMIFEMIVSVLFRSKSDILKEYRETNMKADPVTLPLRMVSHIAKSATGKMVGSYMRDGLDAVLVNASENSSDIEDLLRQ